MRIKHHVFLDRRFFLFGLTMLACAGISWVTFSAGDFLFGVFFALLDVLALGAVALMPCLYIMSERGLRIFYLFCLSNEYIPWETVTDVSITYEKSTKSLPYLFDTYSFTADSVGKARFYKRGEMIRTRRAKRLIEQYTGRKITGYMLDDLKAWFGERRRISHKRKAHKQRMKQARAAQLRKENEKRIKKEGKNHESHPSHR